MGLRIVVDVEERPDDLTGCLTGTVGDFWVAALGFRPRLVLSFLVRLRLLKMGRTIVDVLWGWAGMRGALLLAKINLCCV